MTSYALIATIAVGVLALLSVVAASNFPNGARVPMQWGITGKPTWSAPVWFAVSFTPTLAAMVFALMLLWLPSVSEKARHDLPVAFAPVVGLFLFVHVVHLLCAFWHFAARKR
jgi:uncharacterized BrkB/YihY/UPF0761 family membrane protein